MPHLTMRFSPFALTTRTLNSFAGSVAFCDRLIRNIVNLADVPIEDAVLMATETPAKILGIKNKGVLKAGYDADIVIFDRDINICTNIVNGTIVYSAI